MGLNQNGTEELRTKSETPSVKLRGFEDSLARNQRLSHQAAMRWEVSLPRRDYRYPFNVEQATLVDWFSEHGKKMTLTEDSGGQFEAMLNHLIPGVWGNFRMAITTLKGHNGRSPAGPRRAS